LNLHFSQFYAENRDPMSIRSNILSTGADSLRCEDIGADERTDNKFMTQATSIQSSILSDVAKQAFEALATRSSGGQVSAEEVGIGVAQLDRKSRTYEVGSFRGEFSMYPASVIKLFYAAYLAETVRTDKVQLTDELARAARDMIADSNNDATALVLDAITDTTGGPELDPSELATWMDKRQAVNRWFHSLGYDGVNACQKTWNEGPYGREKQGYGQGDVFRNSLSPLASLRLMAELAMECILDADQNEWIRSLLARSIPAESLEVSEQASKFSGAVLPAGTRLWSKAGWTSEVRHDVAWFELPDGCEFIWAIYTKNHSEDFGLIPFLAEQLLNSLVALGRSSLSGN
jgi:Beta-lactamase enzyme family